MAKYPSGSAPQRMVAPVLEVPDRGVRIVGQYRGEAVEIACVEDPAALDLGRHPGPAREPVPPCERELGRGEPHVLGHLGDAVERAGITGSSRAEQILGLVAQLVEVGARR
jgi:hypothetical protein